MTTELDVNLVGWVESADYTMRPHERWCDPQALRTLEVTTLTRLERA